MKNLLSILVMMSLLLVSCPAATEEEGMATVVFMRYSLVGGMIKTSVYEVTDDGTKFIGIMKNKNKLSYQTTAGKHTFMVVSEAADFMQAELVAGKTYYSMVTPRTGALKARFSLIPVRNDGTTDFNTGTDKFKKWVNRTKPVQTDEKSRAWYEEHKNSVEDKRAKYWEKWQQKSPQDVLARTLLPTDGS